MRGCLLIALSAAGFGLMPVLAVFAYEGGVTVPPLLGFRFAIAAAVLLTVVYVRARRTGARFLPSRPALVQLFLLGCVHRGLAGDLAGRRRARARGRHLGPRPGRCRTRSRRRFGAATGGLGLGFGGQGWTAILGVAFASTVVAVLCFLLGMAILGSTKAAIGSMLEPVLSITASAALIGATAGVPARGRQEDTGEGTVRPVPDERVRGRM